MLIANGLISQAGHNPFKPFKLYVKPSAREASASNTTTDVLVFHGSTDAPMVDVVEIGVGAGTIIDNMVYGQFAGYLSLPTADYVLDVRDETGLVTMARYAAPIQTLGLSGQTLTVVAFGFLTLRSTIMDQLSDFSLHLPAVVNLFRLLYTTHYQPEFK